MSVHLIATLDTKGTEAAYLRDRLIALGLQVVLIDAGCLGEPTTRADIPRDQVFEAAGTSLDETRRRNDRGAAVTSASIGVTKLIEQAHHRGQLSALLGLGGSAGTTIATAAMRSLPLGIPKLMISTLASGQTRHFVGDKDILMLPSIVDILGINRISRTILTTAANATAGMVRFRTETKTTSDKPLIAATMFGVTTKCVEHAKSILESHGYEVLVFHATGNGGQALESLANDGLLAGILDITTTELADELAGGFLSAGPDRLTAGARHHIPQVVSVGALDMVNFFGIDSVPDRYRTRKLHRHNANVTLMRTTADECRALGAELARKLSTAPATTRILLPTKGISAIDAENQPFEDATARRALFDAIRANAGATPVRELDLHINDPAFATACAETLLELLARNPVRA